MAMSVNGQLGHDEAASLIHHTGHEITYMLTAEMGSGKSSMLNTLKRLLGNEYYYAYFDCNTKVDGGDALLPLIGGVKQSDGRVVSVEYGVNAEFGLHHGKKVCILVDEPGKNPSLMPAMTRLFQERYLGTHKLPEGSIVFGATNRASEGLGDAFDFHQYNRITVLPMRKPTAEEWLVWAVNNGVHPTILAFVAEFPMVFDSYDNWIGNARGNEFIFHPEDAARKQFVSGRSLEKASKILHGKDRSNGEITDDMVKVALCGTIGAPAALKMNAFIKLANQMPKMKDIQADPDNALVPDNITAVCMTVYNALGSLKREQIGPWTRYMHRLPNTAQTMFAKSVLGDKFDKSRQKWYFTNKEFRNWIDKNRHLLAADKK